MMNRCQVCGKPIYERSLNCWEHAYVRESMVLLAQDIWNLESSVGPEMIKTLAARHNCAESTVRNHLKRQGFRPLRGWILERRK